MIDLTAVRGRHAERWPQRARQWRTTAGRMIGRAAFVARAAGTPVAAQLRAAWEGSGTLRLVTLGLVVALAYYAGAWLGFLLVFPGSPLSILWPPNAIVLAALLLVPPQKWWIVLLGVLPAHLVVEWQSGVAPLAVPGLYVTNCGEALLGATLVRRWSSGGPPWLGTWRQVVVYVVGAAIAAPFVASFLDTGVVVATRWSPQGYWLLWEERFISAVLTNLTVAPVILLLASGAWQRWQRWRQGPQWWPWRTLPRQRAVEMALLALSILASGYVAFSLPTATPQNTPELLYALAPVLLWAAVRFGVGGISASLLALALLAAGWANASGLFVARAPAAAVVTLQLFLIALGAPALCLAALVQERERDAEMLRASEARYRATFESAAIGVAVVDLTGRPVEVNAYVSQMVGYTADELRAMALRDFTHPDDVADNETLLGSALTGAIGSYQLEKRYRHKDGHTVWGRVSASLVRDRDGQPAYVVVHLEDVTPRKQLEQEREAARAEAERQAEELDRIFETMADGVVVYDAQGQTTRTNMAARTLLSLDAAPPDYYALPGTERLALFQSHTPEGRLLAPDELASSRALRGELLTGASALDISSRAFDGRELALSVSAAPLRDAQGRIVGAVAILHDQTERNMLMQEREEALVQAERRAEELDRVFEAMTDGVAVYDRHGYEMRTNVAYQRLIGLEAAPATYAELSLQERLALFAACDEQGRPLTPADGPLPRALAGQIVEGAESMDIRSCTLDGREVELQVSAAPLRSSSGELLGAVSVFRDVTEYKHLLRKVTEQAEELDHIVEAMGEALFVYDAEGRVIRSNAAAHRLLGLDKAPPEFYDLPAEERMALYMPRTPDGRLLSPQEWLALRTAREVDPLHTSEGRDIHMRTLDGRELEVSASIAPLRNPEGQMVGGVLLLSDRTERNRLAREQEEARARELALREVNQRLDTFVSMAAHDLRRPVAVTKLRIDLAQRQVQKAAATVHGTARQAQPLVQVAHDLGIAGQSLDRLTGFMEQLLDVTRARQDQLTLNRQPCDLVALVLECVEEERLLAPNRRLMLDLPGDHALNQPDALPSAAPHEPQVPPVMVQADAARLGQVVVNYLTNAERYSPEDQPIEISVRVVEQAVEQATDNAPGRVAPSRVARVSVRDHGPGIAPEAQRTIWKRFQRAHTVREAMGTGGLGLGLYIARMIIELHGGEVGVESTPGDGAAFWFTLPLSEAEE